MNRKLLHSTRALAISMSFLVVGLLAASFATPSHQTGTRGYRATGEVLTQTDQTAPISKHSKRQTRARNSGLTLPFFSFAQGLRRGNRS